MMMMMAKRLYLLLRLLAADTQQMLVFLMMIARVVTSSFQLDKLRLIDLISTLQNSSSFHMNCPSGSAVRFSGSDDDDYVTQRPDNRFTRGSFRRHILKHDY